MINDYRNIRPSGLRELPTGTLSNRRSTRRVRGRISNSAVRSDRSTPSDLIHFRPEAPIAMCRRIGLGSADRRITGTLLPVWAAKPKMTLQRPISASVFPRRTQRRPCRPRHGGRSILAGAVKTPTPSNHVSSTHRSTLPVLRLTTRASPAHTTRPQLVLRLHLLTDQLYSVNRISLDDFQCRNIHLRFP
jgi:hypothetical protein